jgi:hypothetical protein
MYAELSNVIRIMIGIALAFTLLDIVYNGRKSAGRSLMYTGVFVTLVFVFHLGSSVISQSQAE